MKNAIQASLIPLMMLVGLGGTAVSAQPAPVGVIHDPSVAPTLDERELEQAIREGETAGANRAEWVIAPAPGTAPAQPVAPLYAPVPTEMAAAAPSSGASSVPHISGGVGYDERDRMEAAKSQYNLRLLFAISGSGSYLSAVKVRIQDARGATLLDARDEVTADEEHDEVTVAPEFTEAQVRQAALGFDDHGPVFFLGGDGGGFRHWEG